MKKFLQNDKIYHLFIWMLLLIPKGVGSIYIAKDSIWLYLINLLIQNGILLALIYINLLVLIPVYFKKGRFATYTVLLLILIVVQIACTYTINMYIYKRMKINEENMNIYFEIIFYFFTTAQYLVISFLLNALHDRFVQRKQIDEIQVQKLNAEVNYLKAQINPHFLFNTLNNLYALSLEKSDKAPQSILMLSKMMDYMLYETAESKVSLEKEIENIENYIGLERIRQGNDAKINYAIQGGITNQKIVPLILLPLIENAFKHGVNQLIRNAYIDIRIEISNDQLSIIISNNYKKTVEQINHGIGLINLRKQLELYYPQRYELVIKDSGSEFDVSLKLNLA